MDANAINTVRGINSAIALANCINDPSVELTKVAFNQRDLIFVEVKLM